MLIGDERRAVQSCSRKTMISVVVFVSLTLNLVVADGPLFMDLNDPQDSVHNARVNLKVMGNVESFSGFLPLDEDKSKALFYWYFPAMNKPVDAPVIVWLQGWQTPGLYGLFMENGPFKVGPLDGLNKRTYAWNRFAHVVYIDSPVGTGFSFTSNDTGYPTNSSAVASDLFTALSALIEFFPELQLNDLYVGGESYAGKYVPPLALEMSRDSRFKLKGIFLGNPLVDPLTQVDYGGYLYQHGLVDYNQSQYFKDRESSIRSLINSDKIEEAAIELGNLIFLPNGKTYFNNATGFKQYYNFVKDEPLKEFWRVFIGLKEVRSAIHVGDLPFNDGSSSSDHLLLDVPRSSKASLQQVLSRYKVLVYAGQDDIICASPMMENMLDSLEWDGSDGFGKAYREIWSDSDDVAGYIRRYSRLSTAMIRNAGHMAPIDQPKWVYLLVKNFITGSPLDLVE